MNNSQDVHDLLEDLGVAGMSGEESDRDEGGDHLRLLRPAWRSDELDDFLHSLDAEAGFNRACRVVVETAHHAKAIPCLPRNCYMQSWRMGDIKKSLPALGTPAVGPRN